LRPAARLDHGLERGGLMGQVAARHLDQIGHQVVPPLELYVDLGKRIGDAVARLHQPVVNGNRPDHEHHHDAHGNHCTF
jgi:hypothetical protein